MDKRYQVFISSTHTDLKDERKAIIEGLLNAKYIPAGMEMFAASNDEQFKYIKKIIDTCDYYVLIIKGRYGSINKYTGISYTEMEYRYAREKNIPILAFVYSGKIESFLEEENNRKLFWAFREEVLNNRLCKMWMSSLELIPSVISSLNEEVKNNPQAGWIRVNIYEESKLIKEINDLLEHKYLLEDEIKNMYNKEDNTSIFSDLNEIVGVSGIKVDHFRGKEGKGCVKVRLEELFHEIGNDFRYKKNIRELGKIFARGVNKICESCFTYIMQEDVMKITKKLCDAGYVSFIIEGNIEYVGLNKKGDLYLKDI